MEASAADGASPALAPAAPTPLIVVVMGVSGCGKSTVASHLAAALGLPLVEGDDWHSPQSVAKMAAGIALTDEDRRDWLRQLAGILQQHVRAGSGCVLACSALRRSYRATLRTGAPQLQLVHLHGPRELLRRRAGERSGHYMPASLLDSQLATLEPPEPGENACRVEVDQPVDRIVAAAVQALRPRP